MTARQARVRFLLLRGTRWVSTGLVIPVLVLLMLDRGLGLTELGLAFAGQGVMVLLLELPTGGLADTLGRRRVLMAASVFEMAALALLIVADTLPLFIAAFALQGIHRALESGPLDAWYVDAAQAADPDADIEAGLAHGGVVLGVAIAVGTVLSSLLVAVAPWTAVPALVTPLLVSLALRVLDLGAIAVLMRPDTVREGARGADVPTSLGQVMTHAVGTIRRRPVLRALVTAELLWGAGMVAFETFTPARLQALSASPADAAALMGPATAVGWFASAVAAASVPRLVRRTGARTAATLLLATQSVTVVGIGLLTGPIGVVVAFVGCMAVHGAANPVHQGILHRAVTETGTRATVVSANSMMASLGGMVGGVALGTLGDRTTLSTATIGGAVLLAVAAATYLRIPITQRVHVVTQNT